MTLEWIKMYLDYEICCIRNFSRNTQLAQALRLHELSDNSVFSGACT